MSIATVVISLLIKYLKDQMPKLGASHETYRFETGHDYLEYFLQQNLHPQPSQASEYNKYFPKLQHKIVQGICSSASTLGLGTDMAFTSSPSFSPALVTRAASSFTENCSVNWLKTRNSPGFAGLAIAISTH
ncbi:hypothetical protein H5410_041786 [Solanum commersonii]|uniref:Uncharacterized protein n=1 Tax=Solanum commersonii TaxID=4109 RepID=A0A9J5XVR0_SOLCO|nr:hypothetical protein H5410_041786 [Solanum commersonii]